MGRREIQKNGGESMARGKKTSPETVYKIMASWFTTYNYKETSRNLDIPVATVKDIVDKNVCKPEFVKMRNERMNAFSDMATDGILKGIKIINDRLGVILDSDKAKSISLQDLKSISTIVGTLYDKRALANGNPTERTEIVGGDMLEKLAGLAGYERK